MTPSSDQGAGLIGTIGGVTIVLSFLLFAVQLLVGLYANTTVTAIAYDTAHRAAGADAPRDPDALEEYAAVAESRLAGVHGRVDFNSSVDRDGVGDLDLIVVHVTAKAPRFIPPFLGGDIGGRRVNRRIRVEAEEFRE